MSTLAAATRFPRSARHRAVRRAQVRAFVPTHAYIPSGTADMWKSAKPQLAR